MSRRQPPPAAVPTPADQSVATGPQSPMASDRTGRGALMVGVGILMSRVIGYIRLAVIARYLGGSMAAGALFTALRIPNALQNLFGEGVLSASFIPVYSGLLGIKDREEADRVAGAVFGLLSLAMAVLVGLGILGAPLLVDVISPGFEGEARELTIKLVRILFPGISLLVLSAWCLGVLNSHRKFFLSYASPVVWNVAIIAALVLGRNVSQEKLAEYVAYGAVVGSALQFGVQLPQVFSLLGKFRPSLRVASAHVRQVVKSFFPVFIARGVVQLSAFIDIAFASFSTRTVASLNYAQNLYLLPVSLFGMSVAAAELPEMSQAKGSVEEIAAKLRERLEMGLARVSFFIVPSAAAFVFLGDVVAMVLQRGQFTPAETRYVWFLLMGSSLGLLASTMGRLYAAGFWALKDTKTPLVFALIRIALAATLAYVGVTYLPGWLGVPKELGGMAITAASGSAAWVEFQLLRTYLQKRIGPVRLPSSRLPILWGCAIAALRGSTRDQVGLTRRFGSDDRVLEQWGGNFLLPPKLHPLLTAAIVLSVYGAIYFGATYLARVPQASTVLKGVARRIRRF